MKPTCDGVSFSWTHDRQGYIAVMEYVVMVIRSEDRKLVKISSHSSKSSQKTFTGLDEDTKYELAVEQKTKFANIGLKATKETNTTTCMFRVVILVILSFFVQIKRDLLVPPLKCSKHAFMTVSVFFAVVYRSVEKNQKCYCK